MVLVIFVSYVLSVVDPDGAAAPGVVPGHVVVVCRHHDVVQLQQE